MKQIVNEAAEPLFSLKRVVWSAVKRANTDSNMLRLDASAYCTAVHFCDSSVGQHSMSRLQELAEVRQPIIFGKRFMAGSPEKGIPVYSSSEMLKLDPEPAFYLASK